MYNLGFLSNDTELFNQFRNIDYFSGFNVYSKLEDVQEDTGVLVVSDQFISLNELIEKKDSIKGLGKIYYLSSHIDVNGISQTILDANDISIVPPKLTVKQIVTHICDRTFGNVKTDNNTFVFFGADGKVGTTMVAQSVAEFISKNKDLKVLLTFMDGTPGTDYTNKTFPYSIDNMKINLMNKILNVNELKDSCVKLNDNLYAIQGTRTLPIRRHYKPKHIEYFVHLLSEEFDVIIIDAGSNIELGMTIGALNGTPNRFLVATQQDKTIENFNMMNDQVLSKLKIDNFMLIVNKYIEDNSLLSPVNIADNCKSTFLGTLPMLDWGWQCEKDKKTLLSFEDELYRSGVEKIAKIIFRQLNVEYQSEVIKKSWLSGLKTKFKGR